MSENSRVNLTLYTWVAFIENIEFEIVGKSTGNYSTIDAKEL